MVENLLYLMQKLWEQLPKKYCIGYSVAMQRGEYVIYVHNKDNTFYKEYSISFEAINDIIKVNRLLLNILDEFESEDNKNDDSSCN